MLISALRHYSLNVRLPSTAVIERARRKVCFVPNADIGLLHADASALKQRRAVENGFALDPPLGTVVRGLFAALPFGMRFTGAIECRQEDIGNAATMTLPMMQHLKLPLR